MIIGVVKVAEWKYDLLVNRKGKTVGSITGFNRVTAAYFLYNLPVWWVSHGQ